MNPFLPTQGDASKRVAHPHRSLELEDLRHEPVRSQAARLKAFLRGMFLRGQPVAVNGVAHLRFYVRGFKLWEYASGLAAVAGEEAQRVLDFGGGGTLPAFYLAARGARVDVLDIDSRLVDLSRRAARRHRWQLRAESTDLTIQAPPPGWEGYDLIQSYCVLEHLSRAAQRAALQRLAAALRPGGRMVLSFEFGPEAPGEGALHDAAEVEEMVAATGLSWFGPAGFQDSRGRFPMDMRHLDRHFTFGLVALERLP